MRHSLHPFTEPTYPAGFPFARPSDSQRSKVTPVAVITAGASHGRGSSLHRLHRRDPGLAHRSTRLRRRGRHAHHFGARGTMMMLSRSGRAHDAAAVGSTEIADLRHESRGLLFHGLA